MCLALEKMGRETLPRQAQARSGGNDPSIFYDPATHRLKPEFAACVNQLRDLQAFGKHITQQATELSDAPAQIKS